MRRVLVVDDSPLDRRLIVSLLRHVGDLEVELVEDGEQALARLDSDEIDLVITDLVMPKMGGLALVEAVHDRYPALPLVLITSQGSEELALRALRAGATHYVPKHLLGQYLAETVATLLEASLARRGRSRALAALRRLDSRFELANDRSLFGPLIAFLGELISGIGVCTEADRMQVCVALEEALVNAAEHGNLELDSGLRGSDRREYFRRAAGRREQEPFRDRRVSLQVTLSPEAARFVVTDQGPGFDPDSLPDPTLPDNILKPSGRGVLLMRTFMDEVDYDLGGRRVSLVKRCSR